MARPKEIRPSWSSAFDERCLREKERLGQKLSRELKDDMLRLLELGTESDLTVLTPGGQVNLHRCIIKQRCPQLLTDLLDDPAEGSTVKLHPVNVDSFNQVVRFIYSEDDLSLIQDDLLALVQQQHQELLNCTASAKANSRGIEDEPMDIEPCHQNQTVHFQEKHDEDLLNGNVNRRETNLLHSGVVKTSHRETETQSCRPTLNGDELPMEQPREDSACCKLARDLLDMLQNEEGTDVVLTAGSASLKCHRCILSARSHYFAAMLGGSWRESCASQIAMEGLSPTALQQLVQVMYGESNINCPLMEVAAMSDMYGLHGLSQIVSFNIKKDKCHFFHKPCAGCLTGTLEVMPLVFTYQLHEIQERALKWLTKHFVRAWPLKQFSALPDEIREVFLQSAISEITSDCVLEMIIDCDCMMGSLSNVRWSEPVAVMATTLMDACIQHLRQNLTDVVATHKFISLGSTMALGLGLLEDVFSRAILTMPKEKICHAYQAVHRLKVTAESEDCIWNGDFRKLVETLNGKCEHCVRLHINYIVHSPEWQSALTTQMQEKIKEGVWYVCVGESGPVRPPPQLSSTQRQGSLKGSKSRGDVRPRRAAVQKELKSRSTGGSGAVKKTSSSTAKGRRTWAEPSASTAVMKPQPSRLKPGAKAKPREGLVIRPDAKPASLSARPAKLKPSFGTPKKAANQIQKDLEPGKLDACLRLSEIPAPIPRQQRPGFSNVPVSFSLHGADDDRDSSSMVSFASNKATVNSNLSTPSSLTPASSDCASFGTDVFDSVTPNDEASPDCDTLPLVPIDELALREAGLIFIETEFVPILSWAVAV